MGMGEGTVKAEVRLGLQVARRARTGVRVGVVAPEAAAPFSPSPWLRFLLFARFDKSLTTFQRLSGPSSATLKNASRDT